MSRSKKKKKKNNTLEEQVQSNNEINIQDDSVDIDSTPLDDNEVSHYHETLDDNDRISMEDLEKINKITADEEKENLKDEDLKIEDTKKFTDSYNKEVKRQDESKKKVKKGVFKQLVLIVILAFSLIYFFISLVGGYVSNITGVIILLSIVLFTICFVVLGIGSRKNNKLFILGSLCLGVFYAINLNNFYFGENNYAVGSVIDLRDKSLAQVIEWSNSNNVELVQVYEYSDMIDEYNVISQDVKAGTKLDKIKKITVAISEGPNPYKEILVPNMLTWDSERVIDFVLENHLSNVDVSFEESVEKQDTVIEQDGSGNLKRNDLIKLVFSYGEEIDYDEVKLIDFTNKSKFESIFYLKQHHLDYEFDDDFSKKIKPSYVMGQDIKAGEMVKINSKVKLTLSKGPEIKVPDLTKMSVKELTNWIIKNKLKVKFTDRYDDTISKNKVIEVSVKNGDKIAQGTVIDVVLSKGQLKMKSFKSIDEFRQWADKYGVKYKEEYEFSDKVQAGEIISYSYKAGDTLKNDDVIIVKISDGESIEVPNLVGLTKKDVQTKLKKLGLNYNFVYKASNTVSEDKVISQSISKGSKVSKGTTITITISTGKAKETNKDNNSSSSNSSSNSSSSSSQNREENTTPTCDRSQTAALNIQAGNNSSQTIAMIKQMNPKHKFSFDIVDSCPNGDSASGAVCDAYKLDGVLKNFCDSIYIRIVR